jgi:hypothetical protein
VIYSLQYAEYFLFQAREKQRKKPFLIYKKALKTLLKDENVQKEFSDTIKEHMASEYNAMRT